MRSLLRLLRIVRDMPQLTIDLMHSQTARNHAFFARVVLDFYHETQRRHRKLPLIRQMEWGVAVCVLPGSFSEYFMAIEAAGRRNYKKAQRSGYTCRRINYNNHLPDIREIRCSTPVRQGALPQSFLLEEVRHCENPSSLTTCHDYPYFGVFKDARLVAYAGGMVAGEVFCLEHIYGHAAFHADGVVPMLLVGMAECLYSSYPQVRYYTYGTFYGAGQSMQRFKKKFLFLPCRVTWVLDGKST